MRESQFTLLETPLRILHNILETFKVLYRLGPLFQSNANILRKTRDELAAMLDGFVWWLPSHPVHF